MYYMIFRRPPDGEGSQEESDSSRLAALNPAHLTHEPMRRNWSWLRFAVGVTVGAVVVEALRLAMGLVQGA
jgi:hypothetical protein